MSIMDREHMSIELEPMLDNGHPITIDRSQSLPLPSEIAHSPVSTYSLPCRPESLLKTCPCIAEPNGLTIQNKPCGKNCIRFCILMHPDMVRWHDQSEKVVIDKDVHGKVGFCVKEVQSTRCVGEKYTLVHSVKEGGAATGKLYMGECILSANQTALQNKTLKQVLSESKENRLALIKCRPMGLIPSAPYQRQSSNSNQAPSGPQPERFRMGSFETNTNDSQSDTRSSSSDSTNLMRTGSKNSRGSSESSNSAQCTSPGSPDVNINMFISMPNVHRFPNSNSIQTVNEASALSEEGSPVELSPQQCAGLESELARILASDMPRLPQLKLIITGTKSKSIAESLLSRNTFLSSNDICTKYKACVMKTERGYEWVPVTGGKRSTHPITKTLLKAAYSSLCVNLRNSRLPLQEIHQCSNTLREICKNVSGLQDQSSFEEVDLEVVAMNETPLNAYCGHVLYTAHSMYIVQFVIEDYFMNQEKVLTYIQTQLTKIRTYASDKVQILLVATAQNRLSSNKMRNIGQNLEEYFSGAFCNQLHYNSATNLPCHFVFQHNQMNDLGLACYLRQASCEDNASPRSTTSLQDTLVRSTVNNGNQFSRQNGNVTAEELGRVLDVEGLKGQISAMVFHQGFIARKYPYQYLVYQEKKRKFCDTHQPAGAQKSHILRECKVEDMAGQEALLKYLHDSGDIICMDYLPYMMSQHLNSRLIFMVLLNRDQLIEASRKLLIIPNPSDQDAPYRTEWNNLQNLAMITQPFLRHLLGTDMEVLVIFLDTMNIIYCMNDGVPQPQVDRGPVKYLVPFYFPDSDQQNLPCQRSASMYHDRILYMDFNDFMPHGTFMSLLIQLIGLSDETRGAWKVRCKGSSQLSFANDCELQITLDPLAATIKINAEWKMPYHAQQIPALLHERMRLLQPSHNKILYKCGPQCPRAPQCQVGKKIHVLDIKDGKGPLWCGQKQVDQVQSVKQWLLEEGRVSFREQTGYGTRTPVVVKKSDHIKRLPFSLYKWICDHLNVKQHSGHNWAMLAEKMGYNMEDILIWRERQATLEDPCDSVLQDWGRSGSATLGNLMEILQQIGRPDMISDLGHDRQDKWRII